MKEKGRRPSSKAMAWAVLLLFLGTGGIAASTFGFSSSSLAEENDGDGKPVNLAFRMSVLELPPVEVSPLEEINIIEQWGWRSWIDETRAMDLHVRTFIAFSRG